MNKIKLYATYNGQCYVDGYRGKFYRKGVELINIEDTQGNIIVEKTRKTMTKALEKCLDLPRGTKIEFDAVLNNNNVSYISNIKEVKNND